MTPSSSGSLAVNTRALKRYHVIVKHFGGIR